MGEKDLNAFEAQYGEGTKGWEELEAWQRSMLPKLRVVVEQEEDLS
jgi:hypothetical protein